MENRKKIYNYDHMMYALSVCAEIQNAGVATVFCEFYGHVNRTAIRVHLPTWISEVDPDYRFELHHDDEDDRAHNEGVIVQLKEILNSGKLSEREEQEQVLLKEKALRLEKYEELKKEFEPA